MSMHTIYFDARCLQDPHYQYRGVGRHSINICQRSADDQLSGNDQFLLVACCSKNYGPIPSEYRSLFDKIQFRFPRNLGSDSSIVCLSPMTDTPAFGQPALLGSPAVQAVLVYDFIPWDHQGYLTNTEAVNAYKINLNALKDYDLFFPISQYSSERLGNICRVDSQRMVRTGVGIADEFYTVHNLDQSTLTATLERYNLRNNSYLTFVGGGDPRKNTDLVARLGGEYYAISGNDTKLAIAGSYPPAMQNDLVRQYCMSGGRPDGIVFLPHVSDLDLAAIYRGSRATIIASLIEGFSIPVVEAAVAGSVVLASDCDAHRELIDTTETIFRSIDLQEALTKLRAVVDLDEMGRQRIRTRQRARMEEFRRPAVQRRFWSAIEQAIANPPKRKATSRRRHSRPRVAFATPWPPQKSGVATYTYHTVRELASYADIDVYCEVDPSDAPPLPGVRLMPLGGSIDRRQYDETFFVIGNSHFHGRIIDDLIGGGGSAIIHDSRLFEYYAHTHGIDSPTFRDVAERFIGRSVSDSEVHGWLQDQRTLPDLFLGDVIEASSVVIVHHPGFRRELIDRYDIDPVYIPFATSTTFHDSELSEARRRKVRSELHLPSEVPIIAAFAYVAPVKGATESIFTLGELHDWNCLAELHFVGNVDSDYKKKLLADAEFCGVEHAIRFYTEYVAPDLYREYLIAVDFGIQLRKIGFGQGSGAVAECAAAGLITVANDSVAESVEAPAYVRRVPNVLSPVLIAEQILIAWQENLHLTRLSDARSRYCHEHSFATYSERLLAHVVK